MGVLKETEGAVTLTDDRRERKVKILKKILADDSGFKGLKKLREKHLKIINS